MKGLKSVWLLTHLCLFIYPWSLAFGQRAEAPVYSDGDSWQVRHEVTRGGFDDVGYLSATLPGIFGSHSRWKGQCFWREQ